MPDDLESGKRSSIRTSEFTTLSFVARLVFSLALVLATYNPSGFSAWHWITGAESLGAVHFLVAVVLFIGWAILWVATWRSLETFGVILAALLLGGLVWVLIDIGILDPSTSTSLAWIVLVCIAVLLSIGLSWSHIWRRLTGQFEVDED